MNAWPQWAQSLSGMGLSSSGLGSASCSWVLPLGRACRPLEFSTEFADKAMGMSPCSPVGKLDSQLLAERRFAYGALR